MSEHNANAGKSGNFIKVDFNCLSGQNSADIVEEFGVHLFFPVRKIDEQ